MVRLPAMTRRCESTERGRGDPPEVADNKPTKAEFLVSFLVDARGGSMTGTRSSGLRIVIPPRAAEQPVRVTCRQLRLEAVLHPPPLNDGEGLAAKILQLTPATFLTPVLVEMSHITPECTDREVVVLRSDTGKKWSLHTNAAPDTNLNQFLCSSINNLHKNQARSHSLNDTYINKTIPLVEVLIRVKIDRLRIRLKKPGSESVPKRGSRTDRKTQALFVCGVRVF